MIKVLDIIDVPAITGVALWISVTDLSEWIKIISFTLAIGYTCRKWYLMEKRKDGTNTK